ncbi:hypothetical protein FG386_002317 [Cryptosporidium ryanae]|uniref:uncharacterized protein n=1 Tax=Cryptosporidium ryanae TaxID=515981 RepID=UPI00351A45FF|nr:hypothetical protein FG386_002317 [Cryptosporidium ryanae]
MKRAQYNCDLSTSPGTTEESPSSLVEVESSRSESGRDTNFWERYESISRMIENILTVLGEYDIEGELRLEKEKEARRLKDDLDKLRTEWARANSKSCDNNKDFYLIKKAIDSTETSISRISNIEYMIDTMINENGSGDEEAELCKDLELDVEYSLLKLSCKERTELIECYQRTISELQKKYENFLFKNDVNSKTKPKCICEMCDNCVQSNSTLEKQGGQSAVGGELRFFKEEEYFNDEGYKIEGRKCNRVEGSTADVTISGVKKENNSNISKSILGGRKLRGENDYLLELLTIENDIQSDILKHISNVIGIPFE